jgi:hypothetical protein
MAWKARLALLAALSLGAPLSTTQGADRIECIFPASIPSSLKI